MIDDPRDSWEPTVAAFVGHHHSVPDDMRTTLRLLARLLRNDLLPKSGRDFLADKLEAIGNGADPRSILPRAPRKKPAMSPVKVMVAVETEIAKSLAPGTQEDTLTSDIYKRIGVRLGLKPTTVEKQASKGRSRVRQSIADDIRAGADLDKTLDITASAIGLSKDRIKRFV